MEGNKGIAVNDLVLVQTYIIEKIIEQKTLSSHVVVSYFDHMPVQLLVGSMATTSWW